MTAAELRSLLERVEKHGGPIRIKVDAGYPDWIVVGDEYLAPADADPESDLVYILVGVLKRDLIERGAYEVYSGLSANDYVKGVNTTVGGVAKVEFGWADPFFGEGDSELKAVLRAWLAAAEAEGWNV